MKLRRFLLLVFTAVSAASATAQSVSSRFLVRISETWLTTHPIAGPNNVGNCLLVMPNGRMHLELRRQEFFDGKASLRTYESTLPPQGMARLRSILDEPTVRALPAPEQPAIPSSSQAVEGFGAEILRISDVQTVGYTVFHGEELINETTTGKVAKAALKPLAEWSHEVKGSANWQPMPNLDSVCGE